MSNWLLEAFVQFQMELIVLLWKILYKSLVLKCLTIFHWTLPIYDDGFGLPLPKLKENTSFYMSNIFWEVFLKLQTSWQWPLHYGKYYRNQCYSDCLTTFHWTLPKNYYEFGLSIPKLRETTLLHMSSRFLDAFSKISCKLTVRVLLWKIL